MQMYQTLMTCATVIKMIKLYDYQIKAINELKNGSILCGGVGSGKSLTAIGYYLMMCGSSTNEYYKKMTSPRDLYIITTAKKRDSLEWEKDLAVFAMGEEENIHNVKVVIDSWNNIKKYDDVYGAFFIFDEQRVVGRGAWVKAFLKISSRNQWILLSATPGDTWSDYIPVFVANGFYRNRSEFCKKHCVYSRFAKFPKIDKYVGLIELRNHRDDVLVVMKDGRTTERQNVHMLVDYDRDLYETVYKERWNPWDEEPIAETGKLIYLMRRAVNANRSRALKVGEILKEKKRAIVFYNFSYELEILRNFLDSISYLYTEWNGEKHQEVPTGERWVYLVQYSAGCEGWNCITTDTVIFYSQNYSYRIVEQASGRIDRINTPYKVLYYYHLHSTASIDLAIHQCLEMKRDFNENAFAMKMNVR